MNILVIGNGFDLAHGLPTTYMEFLNFIDNFQKFISTGLQDDLKNEIINSSHLQYFCLIREERVSIFDEITALVKDNLWIQYFLKILKKNDEESKTGWIDFESEISRVIQVLDSARIHLNKQFREGKETANMEQWQLIFLRQLFTNMGSEFAPNTIELRKCRLFDDLNRLTRCLEIYLSDYIHFNDCELLQVIESLSVDKVLSFNYTDTYKELYGKNKKEIEYCFIHGKANIDANVDACDLVLGIDEYLQGEARDADNEFVQFKKFYQRIYKMTGTQYIDWLYKRAEIIKRTPNSQNSLELNIYIYGHSLDVTDKDILRKLILEDGAKTFIYYNKKSSMGKQIANLVKIIGEEELIKRTAGNNRTIYFKSSTT